MQFVLSSESWNLEDAPALMRLMKLRPRAFLYRIAESGKGAFDSNRSPISEFARDLEPFWSGTSNPDFLDKVRYRKPRVTPAILWGSGN